MVSATFLWIFPAVSLVLGSCFSDFSGFSYFFIDFPAVSLRLGSFFGDFSGFSYFFMDFSGGFAGFGELF